MGQCRSYTPAGGGVQGRISWNERNPISQTAMKNKHQTCTMLYYFINPNKNPNWWKSPICFFKPFSPPKKKNKNTQSFLQTTQMALEDASRSMGDPQTPPQGSPLNWTKTVVSAWGGKSIGWKTDAFWPNQTTKPKKRAASQAFCGLLIKHPKLA